MRCRARREDGIDGIQQLLWRQEHFERECRGGTLTFLTGTSPADDSECWSAVAGAAAVAASSAAAAAAAAGGTAPVVGGPLGGPAGVGKAGVGSAADARAAAAA